MSLLLDESQQEVLSSKEQKINKVPYVYISLPNNTLQLAVSSLIKIGGNIKINFCQKKNNKLILLKIFSN